ncbi:MAG: rhomboid family intramembrane serine protease [Bacteroidota bacterium]
MRMTPVVLNLLIINGLVFLLLNLLPEAGLQRYFLLFKVDGIPWRPEINYGIDFMPVQVVTHFFSHANFMHILFNMYALFLFGTALETTLGSRRFLIQYLIFGLVAGLMIALLDPSPNPVLGASAAISGLLVVFAYYYPNTRLGILFLPFQFRAVHFVMGLAAISAFFVVLGIINRDTGAGVSHFGHFMGMVVAFVYVNIPRIRKLLTGN